MSHRHPQLKAQARLLRKTFSDKGVPVAQGEALEMVARLHGFPSWNVASSHEERGPVVPASAGPLLFEVWTAVHHHRHGQDTFLFDYQPDETQVIERIELESTWEPEDGDSCEVLGATRFEIDVAARTDQPASPAVLEPLDPGPGNVLTVYEVDMVGLLGEYDDPEELVEWQWISSQARFAHVGSGREPGVYEFMLHLQSLASSSEEVPARLRDAVGAARQRGAVWVLFHQG